MKMTSIIGIALILLGSASMSFSQGVAVEEMNDVKIGLGFNEAAYNMTTGDQVFFSFSHTGFQAEIVHIEYFPDSTAKVFMSYAFWGADSAKIYLQREGLYKNGLRFPNGQNWSCSIDEKTGLIDFLVPSESVSDFTFEMTIYEEIGPAVFSEKFSVSAFNVPPINPINCPTQR
jgi:hypothetical protein